MTKPKINDEQLSLDASHVSDIYHQLTLDLFDQVIKRLKERGAASLEDNPYIWQLEKMQNLRLLNEDNVKLIAERSGLAEQQLREVIEGEGYKIYKDTYAQLAEGLNVPAQLGDNQVLERLISYSNQAMNELDNLINTTLPRSVREVYQSVVQQTVAEVVVGIKTPEKALNDTLMKWSEKGFYGFTDRAGKRWKADNYARMIIKSTTWRAFNEARTSPAKELGIDTYHYSIKSSAREMCAPLQNQIVTTGEAREEAGVRILALSDYGYGSPGGCLGVNCGHVLTPFIPGVNEIPELSDYLKGLTPEQAIKNANIEAKQRSLERQIRKNKERLHVAKQLGDKELINKFKLKGRLLDDTLKSWLKDHEFLHRDRERERLRTSEAELQQKVEKALEKRYNEFNKHLTQKISKAEYMDFVSHDLDKIRRVVESHSELSERIALKEVKQEQHILGSVEYTKRDNGQSYFVNTTAEAIHTHMLTNMDMNELFRRYQFVDIGQNKGVFVSDIDGSKDADQIKVHQGKKGIHGVPNQNKHSAERGGINDG